MPFDYYRRLSPRAQRIYDASDRVTELPLPGAERLHPFVAGLREALAAEDRRAVEGAADHLARGITELLGVPPVRVEVLAVRPHADWGELHGTYEPAEGPRPPRVRLWMRTAHHRRVVAFRSFLRTLLHEVGHHLDYAYLKLADSLHTEGFFRRESNLFRQLAPVEAASSRRGPDGPATSTRSDR
jgi:hypothetical protein